ncbi:DNA-binding response regulator [Synergistales bacterium]|nr:DNA-binding response regulator [Synergistales bacterium]
MKNILVVEDEHDILRNHCDFLRKHGYAVSPAENLAQAHEHLSRQTLDAIVLDIMLPDGSGLDLLTELRAAGSKIPIIMLTAWGEPQDVSNGLRLGANDYLSKPFDYEVLLARVEAMFRNVEQMPEVIMEGPFRLDVVAGIAFMDGSDMLLTQKEFALLLMFVQNKGRAMSAEYLYEKIWVSPMTEDDGAVKNTVYRLRKKLSGSEYFIRADRGEGYRFGA